MIAHVAVLLTLLILFALLGMRLPKVIDAGGVDLYRIIAKCLTSVLAVIYFVRSLLRQEGNKLFFIWESTIISHSVIIHFI